MTVVELCGLPGAGKSTLCRDLTTTVAGAAVRDRSLVPGAASRRRRLVGKVRHAGLAIARSPRRGAGVALAVHASGVGWRELVARTVNLLVADEVGHLDAPGIDLLDQGIAQELVSIGVSGDAVRCVRRLPELNWPGAVIALDVPVAVAASRLAGRGTGESRFEAVTGEARTQLLAQARDTLGRVLTELEARGVRILHIDGTRDDLPAQARRVLTMVDTPPVAAPRPTHRS